MRRVHPSRISAALDAAGCYGKRVDLYLGGVEPMVDEWEAGRGEPTPEQVFWLAELTGVTLEWLLDPSPAQRVGIACHGRRNCTILYATPPGADPEGAKNRLACWRSTVNARGPR